MKNTVAAKYLLLALGTAIAFSSFTSTAQADIAAASALQTQNKVLADYRRLLPLEGGSNFRDMGGYRTENGKTIRRGLKNGKGV